MQAQIVSRRVLHSGYLTVRQMQFRLADGSVVAREIESHGDAAAVLPYDAVRCCALVVKLFRAPVFTVTGEESIIEACAGMVEQETPDTTARREAAEELGVELEHVEAVARIWSSPGVSTERQSLFLAQYTPADRKGRGGGVAGEHEGITVVERSLTALAAELDCGAMVDGKLITLILALQLRRPDLFKSREGG